MSDEQQTYTVRKAIREARGDRWILCKTATDRIPELFIGSFKTRRAAVLCARLLAGRGGKVVVEKPKRITAWRVPT